ncbi:MAG: hypothetical protein EZS28_012995 [Streblomastix strix]|uniref:Protein kinase domain-containing protein n=1 Tax=Streblomastix strix TaxID=222440 RepID=A0A5J4W9Y4_9EUKA|nr:MAG: hypothetical protein EZS28_012995 [Streblomastix strix]
MFEKAIERSPEVKDDVLWDLLTNMLIFDRKERISVADALNHELLTGKQTTNEVSLKAKNLATISQITKNYGDQSITQYDTNPLFIVPLPEINTIIGVDIVEDSAYNDSTDQINQSLTIDSDTDNTPQKSFEDKPSQSFFEFEQDIFNPFSGANSLTKWTTAQITDKVQNIQK